MEASPCDCSGHCVVSTRTGTRVHVTTVKGLWCAIQDGEGELFLQSLILPSAPFVEELGARRAVEEAERTAREADEARYESLSVRLDGGEDLTMVEINELTRLGRKLHGESI